MSVPLPSKIFAKRDHSVTHIFVFNRYGTRALERQDDDDDEAAAAGDDLDERR